MVCNSIMTVSAKTEVMIEKIRVLESFGKLIAFNNGILWINEQKYVVDKH